MTKLERVFKAVVKVAGNSITRFQAAEVAAYLLKENKGNAKKAIALAQTPYKIQGNLSW